jgi:hypothetical protein
MLGYPAARRSFLAPGPASDDEDHVPVPVMRTQVCLMVFIPLPSLIGVQRKRRQMRRPNSLEFLRGFLPVAEDSWLAERWLILHRSYLTM